MKRTRKIIGVAVAMMLLLAVSVVPAMACSCEKEDKNVGNPVVGDPTEITGTEKSKILDMALKNSQVKELQKQLVADGFAQKDIKVYTVPVTLEDDSVVEVQIATIQFESPGEDAQYLSFAYNTQTGESIVVLGLWSCVECLAIIIVGGGFGCQAVCATLGVLTMGYACALCIVGIAAIALCPCYDCCCATGFGDCCDIEEWLCD
ncbi:MAG: hypothetical protein KAI84_04540 [Gammaproteobacteria bacterium]|jgi:hypothetical protein|nr:hypothetical protein [Gammaproteobacteria bacterium]